jgi:hypothetical protein
MVARLQTWGADPLAELEHAHYPAQPVEHSLGQQGLHQLHGGPPDVSGQRPAALASSERAGHLLRRHMLAMSRHHLIGACIAAHVAAAASDPQLLPKQAKRGRVKGLLKDHMAVATDVDLLPEREVIGYSRQGLALGPLNRLKAAERGFFRRPAEAWPRGRQAPALEVTIRLGDRHRAPAPSRMALDVVDPLWRDRAFVLWGPGARIAQKAIGLSPFPASALHLGIIEAGLDDPRLAVVEDDPMRHAPDDGERMFMELHPGRQRLIEDARYILMPIPGQSHHLCPRPPERPGYRIAYEARIAKIAPGFTPT